MIEVVEVNTGECRCVALVGRERRKAPHSPRDEFTRRMHRMLRLP
jgi:hypothetical protein